jgi:hypothetical protein
MGKSRGIYSNIKQGNILKNHHRQSYVIYDEKWEPCGPRVAALLDLSSLPSSLLSHRISQPPSQATQPVQCQCGPCYVVVYLLITNNVAAYRVIAASSCMRGDRVGGLHYSDFDPAILLVMSSYFGIILCCCYQFKGKVLPEHTQPPTWKSGLVWAKEFPGVCLILRYLAWGMHGWFVGCFITVTLPLQSRPFTFFSFLDAAERLR